MAIVERRKSFPWFGDLDAVARQHEFVRRVWPTYRMLAPYAYSGGARYPLLFDHEWDLLADTMTAHAAAETGWGIGLYNWSFGNLSKSTWTGDTFIQTDHMPDPKDPTKEIPFEGQYRAYKTQREGAAEHMKYIRLHAPAAWKAAHTYYLIGNAPFLSELRKTGYFSGRVYKHPGEEDARLDSDDELDAQFAVNLKIVRAVTASARSDMQRVALGAMAIYVPVALAAFAVLAFGGRPKRARRAPSTRRLARRYA